MSRKVKKGEMKYQNVMIELQELSKPITAEIIIEITSGPINNPKM